jgi:hypothetical protein
VGASRFAGFILLLVVAGAVYGCATSPVPVPTLTFEQHSLRIPLSVEADGSVSLAGAPPLIGRLDLTPILREEGVTPKATSKVTVQVMMNYGRLYVASEAFRSLWEITPQPGTTSASYRPIFVVRPSGQAPVKGLRFSRYGPARSSCLRLDRAGGSPVFITSAGEARDVCP